MNPQEYTWTRTIPMHNEAERISSINHKLKMPPLHYTFSSKGFQHDSFKFLINSTIPKGRTAFTVKPPRGKWSDRVAVMVNKKPPRCIFCWPQLSVHISAGQEFHQQTIPDKHFYQKRILIVETPWPSGSNRTVKTSSFGPVEYRATEAVIVCMHSKLMTANSTTVVQLLSTVQNLFTGLCLVWPNEHYSIMICLPQQVAV